MAILNHNKSRPASVKENVNARPIFLSEVPEPIKKGATDVQGRNDSSGSIIQDFGDTIKSLVDPVFDNEVYRTWVGSGGKLTSSINDLRGNFAKSITGLKTMLADPRYAVFNLAHDNSPKPIAGNVKTRGSSQGSLGELGGLSGNDGNIEPGSLAEAEAVKIGDSTRDANLERIEKAGLTPYLMLATNEAKNRQLADQDLKLYDFTDVPFDQDIELYSGGYSQATSVEGRDIINPSFKGYKSVRGLTLANTALWDFKLRIPDGNDRLPRTFLPQLPSRYIDYQPITGYDFDEYEVQSKSYDLTESLTLELFDGVKIHSALELTISEDDNWTWTRYFDSVVKRIWNKKENALAPYKQSVFIGELMIYNSINRVYFRKRMLLSMNTFIKKLSGETTPNDFDVVVTFSIVGDLNYQNDVI